MLQGKRQTKHGAYFRYFFGASANRYSFRCLITSLCLLFAWPASAQVRYYYDELGRLVEVVAPDGASAQYNYDAAGNIAAIRRNAPTTLSLSEFTPDGGPVGTTVEIYGSGFSTTAANNIVKFNGKPATVSVATATTLKVTVPSGATTGLITVGNTTATVTSLTSFVVGAAMPGPTISGFAPQVGNVSDVITVTGTNFQLNAQDNKLAFGKVASAVIKEAGSPTSTQLKSAVPSPTASGKISVATKYGSAVSAGDFYALPTSISASGVEFKGRLFVDGAAATVTTTVAGKMAVLLFDGTAGQALHLITTSSTFSGTVLAEVYRPDGVKVETLNLVSGSVADFVTRLTSSGTYTIILSPGTSEFGSLKLNLVSDLSGALTVNGTGTAVSLSAGRNARMSFAAEAGKGYGLAVTGLSFTPTGGSLTATLRKPDGTSITSCYFSSSNSCDFSPDNFAVAGTYLIDFDPAGSNAATFSAVLSKDASGTLTVDAASATTATIARAGQNARYTFTGTAGQLVSVVLTGSTLDDGDTATGNYTYAYLYSPANSQVGYTYLYTGSAGATFDVTLPESGTYTLFLNPMGLDKGAVGLQVKSYLSGALTVNGTGTAVSLSAGRNARMSFAAEAGKGYGLAVTGLSFTPTGGSLTATLRKPDGTSITSCYFSSSNSCDFSPDNFAVAGTYLIDFDPAGSNAATFSAVLSKDASGTLTVDAASATTATIARAGQNARYTFTGTAGQLVSVVLTGSTLDDGDTATGNYTYAYLYSPANSQVGYTYLYTGSAGATFDVTLPESGTYTLFLNPMGLDKGAVGLQVKSYLSGALTVNGTGTAVSLSAGRNARMSFAAEAGKGYGLAVTGLSFTPTGGSLTATLRKPDGTSITSCYFSSSNSCDFSPDNFAVAGTYLIDFDPAGSNAATFSAVLSKDASGTLTVDAASATTATIARAGQNARYTFTGTAGQLVSVVLTGSTLDDGDTATGNYTYAYLYSPANSQVGYTYLYTGSAGATFDVTLPESGTYTLFLNPMGLDKGAVGLQVKSYLSGALTVNGTGTAVSLSAGRNARMSFAAEAGKGYGLAVTGLSFTPTGGSLTATLRKPDGTSITSCYFSSSNSCDFSPDNFAVAGTYLIDFDPAGSNAATFSAVLSKDASGTLTVDAASATTATIARAGQNARYTFTGTAGQLVSVVLTGSTLDDGDTATGNYTYAYLYSPANSQVGYTYLYTGSAGATFDVTLPESGTYTLFLNPMGLDKGAVGLQVKSYLSGALTVNGTGTAVSLSAGRNARMSFAAEAGKGYGLAVTGLSFTPTGGSLTATLRKPDGTSITSCYFSSSNSCDFSPDNFAVAGTYLIDFDPAGSNAATFSAVLSKDASGTLTVDAASATTATIARAGQNARYTFTGTAGQLVSVVLTGSTLDDGDTATGNYTYAYLYSPANSQVGYTYLYTGSAGATFDVTLPESGTYTLFLNPMGLDKGAVGLQVKRK